MIFKDRTIQKLTNILIVFLISHITLLAGDDNLLWRSFVIEKKINSKFNLELEQSSRFYNQISKIKQNFSEINISYKLNDNFKIEIPYRYAIFEKKTKNRLALSSTINHKNKKNTFRYRIKAQRENELAKSEVFLRHKFSYLHKLTKKYEPFIATEFISGSENQFGQINEQRIAIGSKFDLPNKSSLRLQFIIQRKNLLGKKIIINNVLGITFSAKI